MPDPTTQTPTPDQTQAPEPGVAVPPPAPAQTAAPAQPATAQQPAPAQARGTVAPQRGQNEAADSVLSGEGGVLRGALLGALAGAAASKKVGAKVAGGAAHGAWSAMKAVGRGFRTFAYNDPEAVARRQSEARTAQIKQQTESAKQQTLNEAQEHTLRMQMMSLQNLKLAAENANQEQQNPIDLATKREALAKAMNDNAIEWQNRIGELVAAGGLDQNDAVPLSNLTRIDAEQIQNGEMTTVWNGETHENTKVFRVPTADLNSRILTQDIHFTPWKNDPKTGEPIPDKDHKQTIPQGTSLATALSLLSSNAQQHAQAMDTFKQNLANRKEELALEDTLTKSKAELEKERHDRATEALAAAKASKVMGYAVNPQSGELQYVPRQQAEGWGSAFEEEKPGDVNKDRQAVRQLNDVQQNVSRYRADWNAIRTPISADNVSIMNEIVSDGQLGAKLAPFGVGIDVSRINEALAGTRRAREWNALPPELQDLTTSYLRAKSSVIAYQKALTGIGRTNKEQLDIEMQQLPMLGVGTTEANKQLDAFQENIDRASEGFPTNLPGLQTPKMVRQDVEKQAQQSQQNQQQQREQAIRQAQQNPPKSIYRAVQQGAVEPVKPGTTGVPKGATMVAPGRDGKLHYTNDEGTIDYGVAQ